MAGAGIAHGARSMLPASSLAYAELSPAIVPITGSSSRSDSALNDCGVVRDIFGKRRLCSAIRQRVCNASDETYSEPMKHAMAETRQSVATGV
jgi:hypothetical protein